MAHTSDTEMEDTQKLAKQRDEFDKTPDSKLLSEITMDDPNVNPLQDPPQEHLPAAPPASLRHDDPYGPGSFRFYDGDLITVVSNCVTAVVNSVNGGYYDNLFVYLNITIPTFMDFFSMSDKAEAIQPITRLHCSKGTTISDLTNKALTRVAAALCAWSVENIGSKFILAVKQDSGGLVVANIGNIDWAKQDSGPLAVASIGNIDWTPPRLRDTFVWISSAEGEKGPVFSSTSCDTPYKERRFIEAVTKEHGKSEKDFYDLLELGAFSSA